MSLDKKTSLDIDELSYNEIGKVLGSILDRYNEEIIEIIEGKKYIKTSDGYYKNIENTGCQAYCASNDPERICSRPGCRNINQIKEKKEIEKLIIKDKEIYNDNIDSASRSDLNGM